METNIFRFFAFFSCYVSSLVLPPSFVLPPFSLYICFLRLSSGCVKTRCGCSLIVLLRHLSNTFTSLFFFVLFSICLPFFFYPSFFLFILHFPSFFPFSQWFAPFPLSLSLFSYSSLFSMFFLIFVAIFSLSFRSSGRFSVVVRSVFTARRWKATPPSEQTTGCLRCGLTKRKYARKALFALT